MWFERFEIIITSLTRDFLPSSWWHVPARRSIDIGMLAGSFGLFFTLFLLFCRFLPVVAMAEVKTVMPQAHPHGGAVTSKAHDCQPDEHYDPVKDEPARRRHPVSSRDERPASSDGIERP